MFTTYIYQLHSLNEPIYTFKKWIWKISWKDFLINESMIVNFKINFPIKWAEKIKIEWVKTNQNSFSNSSWKTKFFNLIITSLQNDFKIRSIQTFYFKENQSNN